MRHAYFKQGMSKRAIARHFGISRDSVDKMLVYSVPPGYRRTAPIARPKLVGFAPIIDQWLGDDVGQHRKQRHTAKRILERLRDEHGFEGGYTIVKDYVREHQRRRREKRWSICLRASLRGDFQGAHSRWAFIGPAACRG